MKNFERHWTANVFKYISNENGLKTEFKNKEAFTAVLDFLGLHSEYFTEF